MAEQLAKTGRKSNNAIPEGPIALASGRVCLGANRAAISQAPPAPPPATMKAARQSQNAATVPAKTNDKADAIPMLAACQVTARDSSLPSTRSANSFSPVILGAGPANAGNGPGQGGRPIALGIKGKQQMADDGAANPEHIDTAWVDPVRQGDQNGN